MNKAMKVVYIVLSVLAALIVLVVVAVNIFADSAVKRAIEASGSKALKVDVSLGKADLSIMAGELGLQNLVINNPPGYQHPKLLELSRGKIRVDAKSLLGNQVRIKDIRLDGMNLVLEQKGITDNNLQDIIKAIPRGPAGGEAEPSGKKLRIDNLEISNVTVQVKLLPVPGKKDTVTLKLSPIKMTDLGTDNKLDLATLSGKILAALAGGIAEQGAGILPKDMLDGMGSALGKTFDIGKDVIKGTGDLGKEIGKGLKGLLKPKK